MEGKWDAIPNDKKWLFQIVSNERLSLHQQLIPRNGIDMDRVDYLLRDSKYVILWTKWHVDGDKGLRELCTDSEKSMYMQLQRWIDRSLSTILFPLDLLQKGCGEWSDRLVSIQKGILQLCLQRAPFNPVLFIASW